MTSKLKWVGGKSWLSSNIKNYWAVSSTCFTHYIEPFAGGLSVALAVQPENATLNDSNEDLMNFYRHAQKHGEKACPVSIELINDKEVYYRNRELFRSLAHDKSPKALEQKAWLFYYLNKTGFNGLCRYSKKSGYNVPFGKYKTINYAENFMDLKKALHGYKLTSLDFECLEVPSDAWIYCDPPYSETFDNYVAKKFTWDDQVRLARWLSSLTCPVIASNSNTPKIIKLYKSLGFTIEKRTTRHTISANGNRPPKMEILAFLNF